MWRKDGEGELYLVSTSVWNRLTRQYVPKDKQTPALCSTPPKSICSSDWGLSIGRGAWKFARGDWTTIRQDVWLNTPGQNDGGFNIWINGQLIMSANEVRYRENAASCNIEGLPAEQEAPFAAAAIGSSSAAWSGEPTGSPESTTEPSIAAASATSSVLSVSYDDGSYKWSASAPAPTWSEASPAWKRQTDSMIRGDPFLLSTPSSSTEGGQVASTSSAESTASASSIDYSSPTASTSSAGPGATDLAAPPSQALQDCSIGFIGLFFSTFFGGHTADWSPSSDQYTYFKEFQMWINA